VRASEERLAGRGRVLLRPSGTAPVVRVMVEGEDEGEVHREAAELAERVGQLLKIRDEGLGSRDEGLVPRP
jgi:phosphoglucosamine mutase